MMTTYNYDAFFNIKILRVNINYLFETGNYTAHLNLDLLNNFKYFL